MRQIGRRPSWRGITLPELLVVVSIVGLAVTVAVPAISTTVRTARLRSATSQFAMSLKAARMIAVTQQAPVDVTIRVDPDNYYEYVDATGRLRRFGMPVGVRIVSAASPITFQPNGSVVSEGATTLTGWLGGNETETWQVRVSVMGISTVSRL